MSRGRLVSFLAVGLLLAAGRARAEEPPIPFQGRVVDAVSGAAVVGAEVRAGGARTSTDAGGSFQLSLLRGNLALLVTASNYMDYSRRLIVGAAPLPVMEIALVPRTRFSEEVEVKESGPDSPAALPVQPGQVMAVAGSLDNIYRVLQTLPGVTGTDEFGSRLSVRGGSPDENLTFMDGLEIHNPYRLLGLTSAFNPETVDRFEFTPGGFSVRYGDRLSSLLVVENRDGNAARRVAGSSALSLTDANVIFEGRLPRKGTWLLTTRRTYYDLVAERFVHANLPAFRDVQLKSSWDLGSGRRLSLTGVRSREDGNGDFEGDAPGEHGDFLGSVQNDLLSAAFQSRVGRGVSKTVLGWYRDHSIFEAEASFRSDTHRSNGPDITAKPLTALALQWHHLIRDVSLRHDLSLPLGARHSLDTGFELHRLRAGVNFTINGERNPSQANGSSVRGGAGLPDILESASVYTRGGAWIEDRVRVTDTLTLVPGLRLDASGISHGAVLSPRFGASLGLGRSTRLRAAAGLYTQSPGYEKLIQSDYLVDQIDLGYERARHLTLGLERDLARGWTAKAEVYHKRFDHMITGQLESEAERAVRLARYDFPDALQAEIPREPLITSVPTNGGRGTAYGLEVSITRTPRADGRLSGWASYTFGHATREAYGRVYAFDYDRRHALSLASNYRFSPRFAVSATARASSGFPYTPFAGARVASVEEGDRLVPERDPDGRLVYIVAPGGLATLNSARLPAFARLDLRATFRPRGEKGRWQFYAEAINVLRRKNTASIDATLEYDPASDRPRLEESRGDGVPFLPTFGVRFQF